MTPTAYILVDSGEQRSCLQHKNALTEFLGRPLLYHQLDTLLRHGVRRAVICLTPGVLPPQLPGTNYRGMELVRCELEPRSNTDPALALHSALLKHPAELALCLRCDMLTSADLSAFLRWFNQRQEQAALLLASPHPASVAGDAPAERTCVATNAHGLVLAPGTGHTGAEQVDTGFFLLRRDGLDLIATQSGKQQAGESFLVHALLEPLVPQGQLSAFHGSARLLDTRQAGPGADAGRFLADELTGANLAGSPQHAAAFLDRDGTVIVEKHYLHDPDGVELLPGVVEGLRHMAGLGLRLVLVSNQSGVGRGYFGREDVERVNGRLVELLAAQGVRLDAVYLCPHAPTETCGCRKPSPGLIIRACQELGLDAAASFVIGDKLCDVDLGLAVQATSILVTTGYGKKHQELAECKPHHVAAGLQEAAEVIETALRGRIAQ